jgi:hypothetical protein
MEVEVYAGWARQHTHSGLSLSPESSARPKCRREVKREVMEEPEEARYEAGVWAMLGGETAQDLAHKRRQFLFVGATIPQNGKHTPGALLKKWYPNSTWVEGSQLHRSVRDVTHQWLQVRLTPRARVSVWASAMGPYAGNPCERV